jgi:hypothetical protein
MNWFDNPDETTPALNDALRHAKSRALPVTARSHTAAVYIARHRRLGLILVTVYFALVGAILLAVALDEGEANRSTLMVVAPVSLLGGFGLYLLVRWRMRRHGDYRDPGIEVEVGADGIVVRGAGGAHGLRWHEIEAKLNWLQIKGNVYFVGLWVQSPLGQVDLREETYRDGRIAAALIVQGMHEDHQAREKAKIERIG